MASTDRIDFLKFTLRPALCILLFMSSVHTGNTVVFQPSYLSTSGPNVSALLVGNLTDISLSVRTVSASNTTGSVDPLSCVAEITQWVLTKEQVGKDAVQFQLSLNRSLHLCGENETETDCCPKPLCVLETLQVSACVGATPLASLLIQAKIHAVLVPANAASDNTSVIPNQVYQPLGACPCDLTLGVCDVRCCCDKDCSAADLKLFTSNCLPGPFGGQVSTDPDYQCSVQSAENSPDWFPFLCVNSPPENNPYLGLFYQGHVIPPKPGQSFQKPALPAPVPVISYIQGSPIFTSTDQLFTIPQTVLGQCVNNAPVAFLNNFEVSCLTLLRFCPTEPPLQTQLEDLRVQVMNGQGGDVTVDVIDEVAVDLSEFISRRDAVSSLDKSLVCENVTLALDYKFYWKENGITSITVTRTVGSIALNKSVTLATRYSAEFLNGYPGDPNSGNPGYQVGRPVIAGIMDILGNDTGSIQRTSISLWKPVSDGLCSVVETKPVLYGLNSTSGCLLHVGQQNLSQCDFLRETVASLQSALVTATYVAKSGNPDPLMLTDWVNISYMMPNSSTAMEDSPGVCHGIPSHQQIHVWSRITGIMDGIPQKEILSLQVSFSLSSWALDCGGGDVPACMDQMETQLFSITSSVTFIDIPINTGLPKTRFQINFTEYDCSRNDICWPELAFPITKYYTGEPYSQSLAKGLILVFFFITASILGTPWKQIRQAWK
ncbi:tectonic-2 [Xyrichtys novacula]|uniref:Tectonic-2 n=1 Tax=Xyrichtys novacula TaxID=13765 RepID=A0AAV1G2R5_XYRNO|nr:tectonic-2 [Xyrichtys novacula]